MIIINLDIVFKIISTRTKFHSIMKVILEAQDFMGLEPLIKKENFVFDEEKGMCQTVSTILPYIYF